MLRLAADIRFGSVQTRWADELSIDRTWDAIAQKASFSVPNKVRDQKGNTRSVFGKEEKLVDYGSDVRIFLGYYPKLFQEFRGKVTGIIAGYPTRIECEDHLTYQLRRKQVNDLFEDVTLKQLLTKICPVPFTVNLDNDPKLGDIRIKDATVHEFLKELLRPEYGIYSFVRDGELKVGTPYPTAEGNSYKYKWGVNIVNDSLKWQSKEELKWKVKAISPQDDGTEKRVEVGDDTGTVRTFVRYNKDKATLRQMAEEYLEKVKFTGFQGSFSSFGMPRVEHGDTVDIEHRLPGREGKYNVKRVVLRFGSDGYRREIFPDTLAE